MNDRIPVWLVAVCLITAGRVDAASNVVQLKYDAAGNIVTIDRLAVAPIALARFEPAIGARGAVLVSSGVAQPVDAAVPAAGGERTLALDPPATATSRALSPRDFR